MNPQVELIPLRPAVAADRATNLDLLVRITPPQPDSPADRPPLNLGLVIDRSGSMEGVKLQRAQQAAACVVEGLRPTDRVAVTVFDDVVRSVVPSRPAEDRASILAEIGRLRAGNTTALHAGWVEGAIQVSRHLDPRCLNRVILLSDGLANVGETNPDRIASDVRGLVARGVSTSALGIGDDYDENLLEAMARAGDGNFCHIEHPDQLPGFFAAELQGLEATFGIRVSLGIEPAPGVRVVDVLNDLDRTPFGRLKLGNLVRGMSQMVAVRFRVPPQQEQGELVRFRLAWDEPVSGGRQTVYAALRLAVIPGAVLEELPEDPVVQRQFALLQSARARLDAIRSIDRGDIGEAQVLLDTVVCRMRHVPDSQAEVGRLRELQEDLAAGRTAAARKKALYQRVRRQYSREE